MPMQFQKLMASDSVPDRADGQGASTRHDLRILVVEDGFLNQQFALATLEAHGYRADLAVNGQQAVAAMRQVNYDLILMDIEMPVLDGVEATKRIRALPWPKCDVWIVAATGSGRLGDEDAMLAAGLDDHLAKPYGPADLLQKLEYYVANRVVISVSKFVLRGGNPD